MIETVAEKYMTALEHFQNVYVARGFNDEPLPKDEYAQIFMHLAGLTEKWLAQVNDGDVGTALEKDRTIQSQLEGHEQV